MLYSSIQQTFDACPQLVLVGSEVGSNSFPQFLVRSEVSGVHQLCCCGSFRWVHSEASDCELPEVSSVKPRDGGRVSTHANLDDMNNNRTDQQNDPRTS